PRPALLERVVDDADTLLERLELERRIALLERHEPLARALRDDRRKIGARFVDGAREERSARLLRHHSKCIHAPVEAPSAGVLLAIRALRSAHRGERCAAVRTVERARTLRRSRLRGAGALDHHALDGIVAMLLAGAVDLDVVRLDLELDLRLRIR